MRLFHSLLHLLEYGTNRYIPADSVRVGVLFFSNGFGSHLQPQPSPSFGLGLRWPLWTGEPFWRSSGFLHGLALAGFRRPRPLLWRCSGFLHGLALAGFRRPRPLLWRWWRWPRPLLWRWRRPRPLLWRWRWPRPLLWRWRWSVLHFLQPRSQLIILIGHSLCYFFINSRGRWQGVRHDSRVSSPAQSISMNRVSSRKMYQGMDWQG